MGVNGYQYIDDSVSCMICSDECTSNTCDSGPRALPWTQDYDDGLNCQGENSGLCEAHDGVSDVWEMWDITLRDLIILDRNGIEFSRVNLTYNNGIKDRSPIHVDHSFPHRQLIVYLNDPQDKEAKTFILDKKKKKVLKEITPKQYRGIFFPSLPHYHIMPKFGERMVFVITFK